MTDFKRLTSLIALLFLVEEERNQSNIYRTILIIFNSFLFVFESRRMVFDILIYAPKYKSDRLQIF